MTNVMVEPGKVREYRKMRDHHPLIIQGGMGVAVSSWKLAKVVAAAGQLGVVSGVGLNSLLLRILHNGDPGGHRRRAASHFPLPAVAEKILGQFHSHPKPRRRAAYPIPTPPRLNPSSSDLELSVLAAFTEVFLAKENHKGLIGINLLEKLQMSNLPILYGAMLAGVDYLIVGAGIPLQFPDILEALAQGQEARMRMDVEGRLQNADVFQLFSPGDFFGPTQTPPILKKPKFLAIVSSASLAAILDKRTRGRIDGFIVEGSSAGGHNAPPREKRPFASSDEVVYGPKDVPDFEFFKNLQKPFWLAGSRNSPQTLQAAFQMGASGIQVGSAFALSRESGLARKYKRAIIRQWLVEGAQSIPIKTSPVASPTGFPFKVLKLSGTLSEDSVYQERKRICDLGYLRRPYFKEDGEIGYRCPAEPIQNYEKKGGKTPDCEGRRCLCNALFANIGLGQKRGKDGEIEKALITMGEDLSFLNHLTREEKYDYGALDVLLYLLPSHRRE